MSDEDKAAQEKMLHAIRLCEDLLSRDDAMKTYTGMQVVGFHIGNVGASLTQATLARMAAEGQFKDPDGSELDPKTMIVAMQQLVQGAATRNGTIDVPTLVESVERFALPQLKKLVKDHERSQAEKAKKANDAGVRLPFSRYGRQILQGNLKPGQLLFLKGQPFAIRKALDFLSEEFSNTRTEVARFEHDDQRWLDAFLKPYKSMKEVFRKENIGTGPVLLVDDTALLSVPKDTPDDKKGKKHLKMLRQMAKQSRKAFILGLTEEANEVLQIKTKRETGVWVASVDISAVDGEEVLLIDNHIEGRQEDDDSSGGEA